MRTLTSVILGSGGDFTLKKLKPLQPAPWGRDQAERLRQQLLKKIGGRMMALRRLGGG